MPETGGRADVAASADLMADRCRVKTETGGNDGTLPCQPVKAIDARAGSWCDRPLNLRRFDTCGLGRRKTGQRQRPCQRKAGGHRQLTDTVFVQCHTITPPVEKGLPENRVSPAGLMAVFPATLFKTPECS